jgi:hypothetical protein
LDSPSSSKHSKTSKSRSLDLSSIQTENPSLISSSSKRHLLHHHSTIDTDDSSNETVKPTFNIDQSNDVEEKSSSSSRYSYSEQQTNTTTQFLLPYNPSNEQEQEKKTSSFPSGISLQLPPYSASSDPGPYHSSWFNTPTSTFNFRFPHPQDQLSTNAQGSIVQLSTLTKMLCDEPSVFTPISPR